MRLIPVQLSPADSAGRNAHQGFTLHLPPTTLAKQLPQPCELSDAMADCDCLDVADFANDLEMHAGILRAFVEHRVHLRRGASDSEHEGAPGNGRKTGGESPLGTLTEGTPH